MPTIEQVITAIKSAGFKIAYDSFDTPQSLPFLCWVDEGSADFYADNVNYTDFMAVTLELFTKSKSKTIESQVTTVLKNLNIAYKRNPSTFVQSENCYITIFEFTLMN